MVNLEKKDTRFGIKVSHLGAKMSFSKIVTTVTFVYLWLPYYCVIFLKNPQTLRVDSEKKVYKVFRLIWGKKSNLRAKQSSSNILKSLMSPLLAQSFCKISKKNLHWISRTRCMRFLAQFRTKMSHLESKRGFQSLLSTLFTCIALELSKILKKSLECIPKKSVPGFVSNLG